MAGKHFSNLDDADTDSDASSKNETDGLKTSNIPYMSAAGLIAILKKEIEKNPRLADEPVRYNVSGTHVVAASVSISAIYNKSGDINYNIVIS
jgi:hypothetical protein